MSWPAAVAIIAVAIIIAVCVLVISTTPERYRLKLEREKTRRHRDALHAHRDVALELAARPITEADMRAAGVIAYTHPERHVQVVGRKGSPEGREPPRHGWRCTCIVCQDS